MSPDSFELRKSQPLPIKLQVAQRVADRFIRATLDGIQDCIAASGQLRSVSLDGPINSGPDRPFTPDWYVNQSLREWGPGEDIGYGPQVAYQGIIARVLDDPNQDRPFWPILLIDTPLRDGVGSGVGNFMFAVTNNIEHYATIISTFGIEPEVKGNSARAAIRRIARHETAHLFGIPGSRSENIFNIPGFMDQHCQTEYCSTYPNTSPKGFAYGAKLEERNKAHFCPDCFNDFTKHPAFDPSVQRTNYRGSYVKFWPWDRSLFPPH